MALSEIEVRTGEAGARFLHADTEAAAAYPHAYEPSSEVNSIDEFLSVVAEDRHACFFG